MAEQIGKFESLSTRASFNASVRHIKSTVAIVEALSGRSNLATLVSERADADPIAADRLSALLRMVLIDKFGYVAVSRNLSVTAESMTEVSGEVRTWKNVDLVLAYHHPDLGLVIVDPKNEESMLALGTLRKRELVVVYAGRLEKGSDELCQKAASLLLDLLEGGKCKIPANLKEGAFAYKSPVKKAPAAPKAPVAKGKRGRPAVAKAGASVVAAAPAPAKAAPAPVVSRTPATGSRMTPLYSVVVQNELFHNGNVEAWKRIIASYTTTYPNLEVFIYYEGERIMNINSLFKWGKVKHGSTIQFAVAGPEIKDVAKLQRYLMQGASPQFEAFLHAPVSTVLKLF